MSKMSGPIVWVYFHVSHIATDVCKLITQDRESFVYVSLLVLLQQQLYALLHFPFTLLNNLHGSLVFSGIPRPKAPLLEKLCSSDVEYATTYTKGFSSLRSKRKI